MLYVFVFMGVCVCVLCVCDLSACLNGKSCCIRKYFHLKKKVETEYVFIIFLCIFILKPFAYNTDQLSRTYCMLHK